MRNHWIQTGLKFALSVMLVMLFSCASVFSMAEEHQTTEYRVKLAFLYNFSRFITWPEQASLDDGKFNLCILGGDPFGELLDALAGKSVQNNLLEIKRLDNLDQSHICQIIFVSQTGASDIENIMSTLKDLPALTVSDIEGFTAHGGIIQFKLVDNKVRFNININAANHAGLTISSKLLSLATVVRDNQQARP
jgi:hypothetical protein